MVGICAKMWWQHFVPFVFRTLDGQVAASPATPRQLSSVCADPENLIKTIHIVWLVPILAFSQSMADDSPCISVPPIDTVEKAWCVANRVLSMESCLSMHGFEYEAFEGEDRWVLTTRDLNPTEGAGCGSTSTRRPATSYARPTGRSC